MMYISETTLTLKTVLWRAGTPSVQTPITVGRTASKLLSKKTKDTPSDYGVKGA